jgi:hypothetical protein
MARVRDHDSHVGGEMLYYNIRDPLTSFISPAFYDWIDREDVI